MNITLEEFKKRGCAALEGFHIDEVRGQKFRDYS